jgi:hypothetical protein
MLHPDYMAKCHIQALIYAEVRRRGGDEPLSRILHEITIMPADTPALLAAARPWTDCSGDQLQRIHHAQEAAIRDHGVGWSAQDTAAFLERLASAHGAAKIKR